MGFFIAAAFNPNPITYTADRQWLALDQSGFILPSHGMSAPADTSVQPARPYTGSAPGNFAVPRFTGPGSYIIGYAQDVAQDIVVTDWNPDDPGGYMFDSYGAIWPFGSKTPVAPTGDTGAPFGIQVLPEQFGGPAATTTMAGLQMHSGNGKPFGLGGYPTGFGHMISMDAFICHWGGPITLLHQPYLDIVTGCTGAPGTGLNVVRDWKVNPNGSGQFYVLFESGYVYSGAAEGGAGIPVQAGAPQADGCTGTGPPNGSLAAPNGWRWMHVEWGQYIIAVHASGATWGLPLAGSTEPIAGPPPGVNPPWFVTVAPPYYPGYYRDGAIVPHRDPAVFWQVAVTGAVTGALLAGVPTLSGLGLASSNTTTEPTIQWTYAESFGVSQGSISVRVYKQSYINAQGGAFVPGQIAGTADGWINDRNTAVHSDKINRNLQNGVAYRAYVRVKSAAEVWTAWSNFAFTLSIPVPATPSSITVTKNQGTHPAPGTITIGAGGSLGAGELRQFQVSAGGGPFIDVWGAEGTTTNPVTDRWPPTNVALTYRVRAFKRVPGIVASGWRTAAAVVLDKPTGTPGGWRFIDVGPNGNGPNVVLELEVESDSFDGQKPGGSFQTISQLGKTVTTIGRKGDDHTIVVHAWSPTEYLDLYNMLSLSRPILFQNIYGRQWWVSSDAGSWKNLILGPQAGIDTTPIRDANDVTIHLEQVNPPR